MDQSTYTSITGNSVDNEERFKLLSKLAKKKLERLLGWPLCPDDWDNQYIEIGKTSNDLSCPVVDTSTLEEADEVVSAYRLFNWNRAEKYLPIDPATQIHAVKLVRDGVTYKTFELTEYRGHWQNDSDEPYAKYLQVDDYCYDWVRRYFCDCESLQLAVDADWAFEELPIELKVLWANMIAYDLDCNTNVRSETLGNHSYTKFSSGDPLETSRDVIASYAGPNGTLYQTVRSA